ncbi:ABC transporter ATP-binding protein [Herminiimonas fonticola]|uniref:Amino acid/amide ABC transporter ATP-binding protein 1 (HAAT family) n=1 Tax=Herminiimonas fonticola TaxID=303380 RepID=A0A4R6G1Q1_9BURK|nr:ABC transporter ATP-binding protein [Herminiimonas fonticola]RBA23469.1 ABC-type branched-chain amino acid transport systems ATPase component [Herminiimonas fonticola]TDN88276.1 amino acid/amide ABC transporter ATP-binding protein 1 (HAAT family) [Herminiimonas fonticola]
MSVLVPTLSSAASTVPAIELIDVRKSFGKTEIIRGANLQIAQGQRYALIGPNGAGKSTLFNLISGRFPLSSGDILLNGTSIAGRKSHQINRLGLSRSFQITNIFHRLSVFENLRCAVLWSLGYRYSFWHRLSALKDANERSEKVLEEIGLQARRNIEAGLLTYAEQRALEIGITIAGGTSVILLDEPTAGMSRSEAEAAVELIRKVTVGKTLLMVEHDMSVVFDLADRVAVLVYGEIIACDTPAEIRNNQQVQQAYLGGSTLSEEVV